MNSTDRFGDAYAITRGKSVEIIPLRERILSPNGPLHEVMFPEDGESTSIHDIVRNDSGEIVGCVSRLSSVWEGNAAWWLRAMAVAKHL